MVKKAKPKKKTKAGWRREKKIFAYYFTNGVARKYRLKKLSFIGFKTQPTGLFLYGTGGGFNWRRSKKFAGGQLLEFFASKYSGHRLTLTVYFSPTKTALITKRKKSVAIEISLAGFLEIAGNLGSEIQASKEEVISEKLGRHFKQFVQQDRESVAKDLSKLNLTNLEDSDHTAISNFIRNYFSSNSDRTTRELLQKELVIQGRKINLDNVITKFEKNLRNKKFDEKKWQKFLHEEVFFFLSNYIYSIREADVNFGKEGMKKPDFVWIDIYGFLDIFEIKTPHTDLLAKRIDGSHKNFYFSSAASKAISQIEKYILFLEQNVENFEKYLARKTSIPFSVLKPKAFLIIGNSIEFEKNPDKKRDFRLLRRTCKNIEFMTFNELLDNLKNLSSKFARDQNPAA